jgi:hypothetical protein
MAILAGNASLNLGTPATQTLSASGSGATLPAGTYFVKVVGMTLEGYQNSSVASGVATSMNVTGTDGKRQAERPARTAAALHSHLMGSFVFWGLPGTSDLRRRERKSVCSNVGW